MPPHDPAALSLAGSRGDAARRHIANALDGLPTTLAGASACDPEFRTAERIDLDEHLHIKPKDGAPARAETPAGPRTRAAR